MDDDELQQAQIEVIKKPLRDRMTQMGYHLEREKLEFTLSTLMGVRDGVTTIHQAIEYLELSIQMVDEIKTDVDQEYKQGGAELAKELGFMNGLTRVK